MKKLAALGAVLAALTFAAPAKAADVPVRGPIYKAAPAPVFNWTGFYVGAHIGYGWLTADLGTDADGFLGGVQAGYNWQFNRNWVFGIEADIAGTDINNAVPSHIDYIGTIRARLGYTWDRVLVYGTGGFAYSRAGVFGIHDNDTGWVLGAGLEWAFAPRWSAKIEYVFHRFDDEFVGDVDIATVKFGVNYRF